ncbi:hypothetical protein FS837_007532 [Tulasnella sp. UAMH 9824]|nr:hypothetical protein FS837_007532 [Tulasnella sp. UAMH 9824]
MSEPLSTNVGTEQPQMPLDTINSLPIEVLSKIISLVVHEEQAAGYYGQLFRLRLVSTSWLALIDDYPQFWSVIWSWDPEPIWRMALQKSKTAGIDVDCGSLLVSKYQRRTLVEAIAEHMPRVRKLIVVDRDFEYLIENAPSAPRLRSLHLRRGSDNGGAIVTSLHPALWAPNLREIDLCCSRVVWKELLWRNLERLRIEADYRVQELSMEEIFTVVEASPRLHTLDLKGIRLSEYPDQERTLPVVKLEALETLKLNGKASPLKVLNSIIASPTTFEVYLSDEDEYQKNETLRTIGKFASRIADGDKAATLLKLSAEPHLNVFALSGLGVVLSSTSLDKPNPTETFTHLLEGLPPQLCSAVTALEISDTDPAWILHLLPIINSFCPNISHLEIPTLTEALASALGEANDGWLLPHLESLSISRYPGSLNTVKIVGSRLKAFEGGESVAKLKKLDLFFFRPREMNKAELAELNTLVPEFILDHVVSRSA